MIPNTRYVIADVTTSLCAAIVNVATAPCAVNKIQFQ